MSMNNTPHRALLPAPINTTGVGSGGDHNATSDKSHSKPKRAQISVACEVCRRRKAKCDGQRPYCAPCRARGLDCRYSADENTTRMMTLKRKYQAVSERNNELESVLNLMRDGSTAEASNMLERLRAGISLSQLQPMTRLGSLGSEYSGLSTPTSPLMTLDDLRSLHQQAYHDFDRRNSSSSIREKMCVNALLVGPSLESDIPASPTLTNSSEHHDSLLHTERIRSQGRKWYHYVDPALVGADITSWTSITSDNDLLIHLVSIYLAWEAPTAVWLDRKTFLADLINQRTDFCSSVLVNAILCFGCHTSPRIDSYRHLDDAESFVARLRNKTWDQLHSSKEPLSFTSIQAALLLVAVLNIDGHSADALALADKLRDMCGKLGLFDTKQSKRPLVLEDLSDYERARQTTSWSVHNYMIFHDYAARMASHWPPTPQHPLPLEADLIPLQDDTLLDHFRDTAALEAHGVSAFLAYSSIQVIQARIALAKFNKDDAFDIRVAGSLYNELIQWTNSLPELMRLASLSPHALTYHMICHSMILDLFFQFKDEDDLIPVRAPRDGKQGLCSIEDIVTLSRHQISKSLRIYRTRFGFTCGPLVLLQIMFISCIDLVREIEDSDGIEMLSNVIRAMKELSMSFWIEKRVTQNVAKLLNEHKERLPDDVQDCLWKWGFDDHVDQSNDDLWDVERRLGAMHIMMDSLTFEKE